MKRVISVGAIHYATIIVLILIGMVVVWRLVIEGVAETSQSSLTSEAGTSGITTRSSESQKPLATALTNSPHESPPEATTSKEVALGRIQTWLQERLSAESFATGVALLKDESLSEQARVLVLDKLHSWRRRLSPENLRVMFTEIDSIARGSTQPKELRARAVNALATTMIVLQEQSLASSADVQTCSAFLTEVCQTPDEDSLFRGKAIRALGILKADGAGPILRELLGSRENADDPELARNACLALAQVDGATAVPTISKVLETTSNEAIYGTAAFALGQIQTPQAMASLVRNESRFPSSGSVDAVLVNMEDLILRILRNPQAPNLTSAVEATRHLWKDGQRDKYTPLLRSLVADAPLAVQQAAVGRLIEDSRSLPLEQEQQALSLILPSIANNPELANYAQQIQNRLDARPLVPNAVAIPTVSRPR